MHIRKLKEYDNKKNIVDIDSRMEKFSCFLRYLNIDVILFFLIFFVT